MSNWTPSVDREDRPLYVAIANQIARAMQEGSLPPGARLPTHRDLANRLGISIHTVSQAYAEAERRGLVAGEVGRGTFVRRSTERAEASFIMDRRLDELIDLSINRPIYEDLHVERVQAVLADLARADDLSSMLVCRPIGGIDAHRAAGADWLRRREMRVGPERVVLCNGVMHGMLVALSTLTRPGDRVLTEALTDHGLIGLAEILHFRLEGLPFDDDGLLPGPLDAAFAAGGAKALCITPCQANPTVTTMSSERRREVATIARRHGVPVVENDVYGMLPRRTPPPFWTFLPEQTYHLTSLTKCLMSGLRTGYLVAPERAVPALVRSIRASSWMATPLVAEIAARWIDDGTADELVAWQREQLAARHRTAERLLAGLSFRHHPHSLHLWLTLPEAWRAEELVSEARLRGVAITPAAPFTVSRDASENAVRISLGGAATATGIERGLARLVEVMQRQSEPFYMPT
jgi:DNA-binding transcriptional MocR family regulator